MAKKESKAKQRVSDFTEQLDNVFLAGLGAFANAQKMGSETFESLVKDGEKFRKEASKKTEKLIDEVQDSVREMRGDAEEKAEGLLDRVRDRSKLTKLQSAFDRRVADAMDRLNVPSKNDIDKINKKLDKILKAIEPKATKPATRKKAAAKKAPAKKAVAKKAPAKKQAATSETKAA
jgi:poly(hydroxyalkanoate) granule-associated protein